MILTDAPDDKVKIQQGAKVAGRWKPSIRAYLIFMNLILLCLLFPAISLFFLSEQAKFRDSQLKRNIEQMRKSLENRSASLSRNMALSAGQAIAGYNFTFLKIMVDQVVANDPEMIYCVIMNSERKAVVHSDAEKPGSILNEKNDYDAAGIMKNEFLPTLSGDLNETGTALNVKFLDISDSNHGGIQVMEAITPIYDGTRLWGVLRCGYSLKQLHEATEAVKSDWVLKMRQFTKYLITLTLVFFSIGVVVAALFTRTFLRSMYVLSTGVSKVSEGNLDHVIQQRGLVCSEFMALSGSFNEMTAELKVSYRKLDEHSRFLEHKVDERTRELKEAQQHLMQQAHEAGMAEMAVGILHNIGNAVTPAKVGTSLLLKQLRDSSISSHLQVAVEQIYDAVENLSTLPGDEKKRMLAIIKLVPKSIREEYERMIDEILKIREKHEHIENIINLQMHYARLVDVTEEVDIHHIIDDALKMLGESIRNRSITIVKHFSSVPKVVFDQTKLIQIVVNLLKNGIEAMDGLELQEPCLEISTSLETGPPDFVKFSVRDIGAGFVPEEKDQLFSFGYTTKARGSGFGLHSCANYLIANKGTIAAQSDGPGKGATFVVGLRAIENSP